jgi:hypothetical protein
MKTLLIAFLLLAFPLASPSLTPQQAPDPSEMVREPIWAGNNTIILCFGDDQFYMYRVEKLPYQFSVHGSGWQEYIQKTYNPPK